VIDCGGNTLVIPSRIFLVNRRSSFSSVVCIIPRIFQRDLNFSSEKDSLIIEVACRLHNFVIDEEALDFSQFNADNNDFSAFDILPLELGSDENNRGFLPL